MMLAYPGLRWMWIAVVPALAACGHSEEEWRALVARHNVEVAHGHARQKENDELRQHWAETKEIMADLDQRLEAIGLGGDLSTRSGDETNAAIAAARRAFDEQKAKARALEVLKERIAMLRAQLGKLAKPAVAVHLRRNRLVIGIPADALFDPGRAEIKPAGKEALVAIANVIEADPTLLQREYQVMAHTDAMRPVGGEYADNWMLSLARARQVVVFLTAPTDARPKGHGLGRVEPGAGLPPGRWSAAGLAETDPVAPNDTPENMQRNRRIEIVFLPSQEETLDLRPLGGASGPREP